MTKNFKNSFIRNDKWPEKAYQEFGKCSGGWRNITCKFFFSSSTSFL